MLLNFVPKRGAVLSGAITVRFRTPESHQTLTLNLVSKKVIAAAWRI